MARPTAFDALFSYLYRARWKVPLTLDGLTAQLRGDKDAPRPIPWTIDEKMDEFLSEIAEVRHEAQYSGFGADSYAFDAMINDEGGPYQLHLRSEAMMTFASSFATDVVRDLLGLLEPIQHSEVVRQGIQLLALFPVHDAPRTSEIAQEDLRTALDRLDDLLRRDAK